MEANKKENKIWIPVLIGFLFFVAFVFITVKFFFQASKSNDELISQHIQQLNEIFHQINNSCKILGFKHQKDHIDFLTVKEFEGSIIGSMVLEQPEKWQGPYLPKNLTISGKDYQIVRVKSGYYIVPPDGTLLANGQIIGKTIKFNPDTDIESMINNKKYLFSTGKVLAAYIETAENPLRKKNDELIAEHIEKLKNIFQKINKECQITGFRHEKDHIDFLNVKSFSGSIVGSMNLVYPEKWEGPYLKKNLTIDGKFYQIVRTKFGYYIIPDDGIDLANGQIVNETLIIKYDTNIDNLIVDPKGLMSNGRPLAAKIETVQNAFEVLDKGDFLDEEIETIS